MKTRPSGCGLWEHASTGAAQRYVRLAQTRRTARTWQLNTGAAAMRTRYGPGVSIPTTDGAEIEALAGSNPSFAAWEQNEPYTIALLIKGRSGGASTKHLYRSGTSSTADHILFLTSGTTPNLRHQATPAPPPRSSASTAGPRPAGASSNAMSGARNDPRRPPPSHRSNRRRRRHPASAGVPAGLSMETRAGSRAPLAARGGIAERQSPRTAARWASSSRAGSRCDAVEPATDLAPGRTC